MTETLSRTIESIYANLDRPDGWERILATVTGLTGAVSGCLVSAPPGAPGASVGCFYNIDPDWIEAYNAYYHRYDPTPAIMQRYPGQVRLDHVTGPRPGEVSGDRRTFFHEVMRPQQFRHTLALGLSDDPDWQAGLVLQRTSAQGRFDAGNVSLVRHVSGHLRQALDIHTRLTRVSGLQVSMAAALENSPLAALLLDDRGRVIFVNQRAETLLADHPAVTICRNKFSARRVSDNSRLQRLLHAAVNVGKEGSLEHGGKLRIENSIHLDVRPLKAGQHNSIVPASQAHAVVWLSAVDDVADALSAAALREYYDLTPAEAELLSLLIKGKTLTEIAELRAVKRETVRGQLKMIKSKFGVSRQADLVRHVLSGPLAG